MLREISVEKITETVSELCIRANKKLPPDIEEKIINQILSGGADAG